MDAMLFLADLEAKPGALRGLADALARGNPWRERVAMRPPVLLLGMGSSRFAASTVARRLRAHGLAVTAEYASADPLPRSAITTGAVISMPPHLTTVGVSASGTTRETIEALERCVGRPAIALTNHVDSPIAEAADVVFPLLAGEEAGEVACRTFQHTLALLLMLDATTAGRDADDRIVATIRRAAEATEDLLERRDAWLPTVAGILGEGPATFAIAPAERLSSAEQAALMFREGPRRTADACESGDWLHVDVYLTKPLDYRALLFAGSRFDAQIMDWVQQRGSTVVAVGADVEGAVADVRYVHDDDADVALLTEVLVAELVAATWWNEGANVVTKRDKGPTRKVAIRLLQQGHDEVGQLLDRLPKRALITGGLGGGEWSPKDLVGHLESWEEYSLEALDAWEAGHGPEIDKVFRSESTATVNREAVERKASRSGPEMRRHAEATHRTLIGRLEALTDQRWRKPGTRRSRKSVGERLGGLLGGPAGPFRHAEAHLKDLEAFVERHGR